MSVLGAGFFGPTEGEKKRRLQGGKAHAWKPMCGDPYCDIYYCHDCGDEFSEPCARHEGVDHV